MMISSSKEGHRFRFRRYREEFALRSQLSTGGTDEFIESTVNKNQKIARLSDTNDNDGAGDSSFGGTVVQNLSDASIVIERNGMVSVVNNKCKEGECCKSQEHQEHPSVVPEGTTLLFRSIRDCCVRIHLPLPAVHFVQLDSTTVDYSNDQTGSNTTIHMTKCHGGSSLRLGRPVQQMRIHESKGLTVITTSTTSSQWNPGSIILEATKDLVLVVPPLPLDDHNSTTVADRKSTTQSFWHQVIVKDFQWLRKGVPSPNVNIEVVLPQTTTEDKIFQQETTVATDQHSNSSSDTHESDDSDDEL